MADVPYRLDGLRRRRASLLRNYLLVLGAGLFLQGAASLLVEAIHGDAHGASRLFSDPRHATIHLVWGAVAIQVRDVSERALGWFGVAFGVFYIGLLVLGLAAHHPFGLMLDRDENVFHAVIGPLTLVLALRSLFAASSVRPTHLRLR